MGIDTVGKTWIDLAVDTSIYNYNTSLNQPVYAWIRYIAEAGHFDGSLDVYPPSSNGPTAISPATYDNVTWPVLRLDATNTYLPSVGQYLWVRLSPTCHHAMSFAGYSNFAASVRPLNNSCFGFIMLNSCND